MTLREWVDTVIKIVLTGAFLGVLVAHCSRLEAV